jgi:hypothetical protein
MIKLEVLENKEYLQRNIGLAGVSRYGAGGL